MRLTLLVVPFVALAACAPEVPDSGAGVGFRNYSDYLSEQAAREAALRGQPQTVLPPEREARPEPEATDAETPEDIVREASAAIDSAADPQQAEPATTVEEGGYVRAEISDEQDFEAVTERETIASDRERIERNRELYRVIQPTDLPQRPGNLGPNIVDFALATNNEVGQPLYRRTRILAESRFNRNCARYSSSDLAQQDFLAKGGPERDRMGLDPDGDGFACYWDPSPFRAARRAAAGN